MDNKSELYKAGNALEEFALMLNERVEKLEDASHEAEALKTKITNLYNIVEPVMSYFTTDKVMASGYVNIPEEPIELTGTHIMSVLKKLLPDIVNIHIFTVTNHATMFTLIIELDKPNVFDQVKQIVELPLKKTGIMFTHWSKCSHEHFSYLHRNFCKKYIRVDSALQVHVERPTSATEK